MDLVVSLVEVSVEFVLSARSSAVSLVRMALHRVSKATENEANVRIQLFFGTLMDLYLMPSGLRSYHRKPTGGDGWAWGTGRKWNVPVWVPLGCLD